MNSVFVVVFNENSLENILIWNTETIKSKYNFFMINLKKKNNSNKGYYNDLEII